MTRSRTVKVLSEIADLASPASAPIDKETEYPVVPMAAIDELTGLNAGYELVLGENLKSSKTKFVPGDILFAKITPCVENGKVSLAPAIDAPMGFATTEVYRIGPGPEADQRYLLHFLRSPGVRRAAKESMTGSTGRRRVPRAFLEGLEVPLPPLEEQRRIVGIIESFLTRATGLAGSVSELAREENAILLALISNSTVRLSDKSDWIPLSDWVRRIESGWSPSCLATPARDDGWGVVKVSAVSGGYFRPEENKALPSHLAPRPELLIRKGDFLSNRANTRELVGRACLVHDEPAARLLMSDKIFRFVFQADAVEPIFLKHLMDTAPIRKQLEARATGTSSSMLNISKRSMLAIRVPPVPLAEQKELAEKLRLVAAAQRRIGELRRGAIDELKAAQSSLLERAFRGAL